MGGSDELLNIRWAYHGDVLRTTFKQYLRHNQMLDVTLSCQEGEVKCHRLILAAGSAYFGRVLSENPEESHLIIFLKDSKLWELRALVRFMYDGEVTLRKSLLYQFFKAGKDLEVRGLLYETLADDINHKSVAGGPSEDINIEGDDLDLKELEGDEDDGNRNYQQEPTKSLAAPPQTEVSQEVDVEENEEATYFETKEEVDNSDKMQTDEEDEMGASGPRMQVVQGNDVAKPQQTTHGRTSYRGYGEDIRNLALMTVKSGMSVRNCSEMFGISRKTIRKWQKQTANQLQDGTVYQDDEILSEDGDGDNVEEEQAHVAETENPSELASFEIGTPMTNAEERAERLKNAARLALSGATVRYAASQYNIPRTTLNAYMKRQGMTKQSPSPTQPNAKRTRVTRGCNLMASGLPPTSNNDQQEADDGIPMFGLSALFTEFEGKVKEEQSDNEAQYSPDNY